MALLGKMLKHKNTAKGASVSGPVSVTSKEYFDSFTGKAEKWREYMHWYQSLSSEEKQRVNHVINSVSSGVSLLNRSLPRCSIVDGRRVSSGRIEVLPIKNLIPLRYVSQDSKKVEMTFRATGFVVCADEKEKAKDIPGKLDIVVIKSNGELFKYCGVNVLKQGQDRYYLNFNGFTSFELDKTMLRKYSKGIYNKGQALKDLPDSEFILLEDIIDKSWDLNIHKAHDYEAAQYKKSKGIEK